MADSKISELTALTSPASDDVLAIVDTDAGVTKKITVSNLQSSSFQFVLEDGDGTEVTINNNNEVKFVEGGGIDINWTDTDNGSDADPYDLTFSIDSTVATLTGSQTLTNKTLTSPVLNTGVSGTAVKDEDNMASDSATHLATQQSIKAYVDSTVAATNELVEDSSPQLGGTLDTNGNLIQFGDSGGSTDDRLQFGASQDLQIYHDGTDTIINNATGTLKVQADSVRFQNAAGNETIFGGTADGAAFLVFNDATKIATTATGVDITGGLTATAASTISVTDNSDTLTLASTDADSNNGPKFVLNRDSGSPADGDNCGIIKFKADDDGGNSTELVNISATFTDVSNGAEDATFNISSVIGGSQMGRFTATASETVLNDDPGDIDFRVESNGNANCLHVDGGNSSVGINTTGPSDATLEIHSAVPIIKLQDTDDNSFSRVYHSAGSLYFDADKGNGVGSSKIQFGIDDTERMRIDSSGNVGIGTTSIDVITQAGGSGYRVLQLENNEGGQINLDHTDAGTGSTLGMINFNRAGETVAHIGGVTDGATDSGHINFRTQPASGALTERMRITSDGKVGIGTTSPDRELSLGGVANARIGIISTDNSTGACQLHFGDADDSQIGRIMYEHDGNKMTFHTAATERMRIHGGGNISIGTTGDPGKLTVSTASTSGLVSSNADELVIEGTRSGMTFLAANDNFSYINFGDNGGADRGSIRYGHSADSFSIQTASAEVFSIDSTGITMGAGAAADRKILFDGNAQNFHIGLDDSEDKLTIGLGNNLGTTPAITIDENTNVVIPDSSLTIAGTGNYDLLTLKSTDADANVGPVMNYYRNSSSPADNDYIGKTVYVGRNDNSQDVNYVAINVQANDVSDGTEDGSYVINTMRAGALDQTFSITPSEVIINDDSKDVDFRVESNGNANMITVDAGNNVALFGKASSSIATAGVEAATDKLMATVSSATVFYINRLTNDGTLAQFHQAGTEEGSISVSGSTVSYNGFTGGHWSRLSDNSKPTILRGTIMDSIDEMCDWYQAVAGEIKEPIALGDKSVGDEITFTSDGTEYTGTIVKEDDVKHNKCKVSDTADSKKVYGVFSNWDDADDGLDGDVNDMNIAQVGTYIIRVNKDVTVEAGDLLVSNGDGTAKLQDDDIIRSKTVAKVNSNVIIETYSDGSYTVPCTLHC